MQGIDRVAGETDYEGARDEMENREGTPYALFDQLRNVCPQLESPERHALPRAPHDELEGTGAILVSMTHKVLHPRWAHSSAARITFMLVVQSKE